MFTKGGWYWEYNDQHHHNLRSKSTHPSGCEEDKHILFVAPDFMGEDSLINDDDANLIAAAPDMYEALKNLWAECDKIGFPLDIKPATLVMTMGNTMKALARAEGHG